jgi:hypothetical protein
MKDYIFQNVCALFMYDIYGMQMDNIKCHGEYQSSFVMQHGSHSYILKVDIHSFSLLTTSNAPSSVIVIAGFNAACCDVPDNIPTALVSMRESKGPQSHIPIAGIAKRIMFFTVGASIRLLDPSCCTSFSLPSS